MSIEIAGRAYDWEQDGDVLRVWTTTHPECIILDSLDGSELIGERYVEELIQHAIDKGWRPDAGDFKVHRPSMWDESRELDNFEWRRLFSRLVASFEEFVGGPVEVGSYWWSSPSGYAGVQGGCRIRWWGFDGVADAAFWEGGICIGRNRDQPSSASVFGFPLVRGQFLGPALGVEWVFIANPSKSRWEVEWTFYGQDSLYPGEFVEISQSGDLLLGGVEVEQGWGQEIHLITLRRKLWENENPSLKTERFWASLHSVYHIEKGFLVEPAMGHASFWGQRVPACRAETTEGEVKISFPMFDLDIPGGWIPGAYSVSIACHSVDQPWDEGCSVSKPFEVYVREAG